MTELAPSTNAATPPADYSGLKQHLLRAFWFGLVPFAAASLCAWLVTSSPTSATDPTLDTLDSWLRDQALLVWLGAFVLTSALLRYWQPYLPPSKAWKTQPRNEKGASGGDLLRLLVWIAAAAALALGARSRLAEARKVRTSSMLPTLYPGDLMLIEKWGYTRSPFRAAKLPARGQAILFETPDPSLREVEPALFKRVIGLPGDVLTVERGQPVINGWRVPRCPVGVTSFALPAINAPVGGALVVEWLGDATYLTLVEGMSLEPKEGPYTVKDGELWVLGDNRNNSSDSRSWFQGRGGGVPVDHVLGSPAWTLFNNLGSLQTRFRRVDLPALPPGASPEVSQALAKCLADKPSQTLPPAAKKPSH